MVKIIMHGCCGHMGQVISQIVKEDADAQILSLTNQIETTRKQLITMTGWKQAWRTAKKKQML